MDAGCMYKNNSNGFIAKIEVLKNSMRSYSNKLAA
jgi:hypothetical protein